MKLFGVGAVIALLTANAYAQQALPAMEQDGVWIVGGAPVPHLYKSLNPSLLFVQGNQTGQEAGWIFYTADERSPLAQIRMIGASGTPENPATPPIGRRVTELRFETHIPSAGGAHTIAAIDTYYRGGWAGDLRFRTGRTEEFVWDVLALKPSVDRPVAYLALGNAEKNGNIVIEAEAPEGGDNGIELHTAGNGDLVARRQDGSTMLKISGHSGHPDLSGFPAPNLHDCGKAPVVHGTDRKGFVTLGVDATGCRIVFNVAFPNMPSCVVTSRAGKRFYYDLTATHAQVSAIDPIAQTTIDYDCAKVW